MYDREAFYRSHELRAKTEWVESCEDLQEVLGTTSLYEDGRLRCVPMPTPDPKDPLNLPTWRKWMAIVSVCFFGALALSGEAILGALIPVFVLEYAGVDPKILGDLPGLPPAPDGSAPASALEHLASLGGPPVWKVSLLATLPLLTNGISSYFLVPASIAVGRRPVLLLCGIMAWAGGFWAGVSQSLPSHLAARCFQALGAGAVEALIPLIVQDLVFIHQRNRAMSAIWAAQGAVIIAIGVAAPIVVANIGWRLLYFITAGLAAGAWILVVLFVPESRWMRTPGELSGKSLYPLMYGESRPPLDYIRFHPRSLNTDIGIFNCGFQSREAGRSMLDTLRTMVFPNMIWMILLNSAFISINAAAGQTGSTILLAAGWSFRRIGLAVIPIMLATPFVWFFGGFLADKVSNWHARRNGGRREPEAHLLSLVVPLLCGIAGCLVFGYAGENVATTHWTVLLGGIFLLAFSFLTVNTVAAVYVVESYPQWAGPVLVNVSSFRCIVGFAMSFKATDWIRDRGYFGSFAIYAAIISVLALGMPIVYMYGKRLRAWTGGRVQAAKAQRVG